MRPACGRLTENCVTLTEALLNPTVLCADCHRRVDLGASVGRRWRSQRAAAVSGNPRAEAGEGLAKKWCSPRRKQWLHPGPEKNGKERDRE
jgi:hypothetical protein